MFESVGHVNVDEAGKTVEKVYIIFFILFSLCCLFRAYISPQEADGGFCAQRKLSSGGQC